jgi:ribonuclease HII
LRVCGVDDAGRGPVIGPLVIAGVLVEHSKLDALKSLGVKDSKKLTAPERTRLAGEIPKIVDEQHVLELDPSTIDRIVHRAPKFQRLNLLEAKTMAAVIEKLRPDVAYVDASDVDCERYKNCILDELSYRPKIVSEHNADVTYPVVSAASILAKVRRDQRIEAISKEFGDFGSGYAHDPKTRKFLEEYYRENGDFPPIVRKSWATLRQIDQLVFQSKLIAD